MQMISIDSVQEVVKTTPRAGEFRFRRLHKGIEGSPNNFTLELVRLSTDFYSPRHRHNFDQFRFQLEGNYDFARNGKSPPGTVIYHPESAPYGPQKSNDETLVLVLQFGGASGNGYMSAEQLALSVEELKQTGSFENGVYRRTDGNGKTSNRDGFEAAWEHFHRRAIEYAPPRYRDPVFMHRDNYDWIAAPDQPGVSIKLMGTFTERRTEVGFVRLDAGATHGVTGPKIHFVVSGEGGAGGEGYQKYSTIHAEPGERVEITAASQSEIYFMGLPDFDEAANRHAA